MVKIHKLSTLWRHRPRDAIPDDIETLASRRQKFDRFFCQGNVAWTVTPANDKCFDVGQRWRTSMTNLEKTIILLCLSRHNKRAPIEQWKWKDLCENNGICLAPEKRICGRSKLLILLSYFYCLPKRFWITRFYVISNSIILYKLWYYGIYLLDSWSGCVFSVCTHLHNRIVGHAISRCHIQVLESRTGVEHFLPNLLTNQSVDIQVDAFQVGPRAKPEPGVDQATCNLNIIFWML